MWLIAFLLFNDPSHALSKRQLSHKIDHLLASAAMEDSFWGVVVYAPLRGKVLYQRLPNKNFRPASNMKILTTLMGFEYLGADYQFQTPIFYRGHLDHASGVLEGDLIVKGRGDPSLSGNYGGGSTLTEAMIRPFLVQLAKQGLREVRGDLIADTSYFDQVAIQKSWEWDDLGATYATPVTPLSLHDGWIEIELWADEAGQPQFSHYPPWVSGVALHFDTESDAEAMDLTIVRQWGGNQLRVSGKLPACSGRSLNISAWNPNHHFLETWRGLLQREGIVVRGENRIVSAPAHGELTLVDTLDSANYATLAQTLMKVSQNHYADCVLKTIGREVGGQGSFEMGAQIAEQFIHTVLHQLGEPNPSLLGVHIRDGSGLSAQNYLRPNYLVALLRYGLSQPYAEEWLATFPTLGMAGTLSRRGLKNSQSRGRVWAKTGYIYRTRTLSGYALTLDGEPLIFSMMANNYSAMTAEVNRTQDHICDLLVRLKSPRSVKRKLENHPTSSLFSPALIQVP